MRSIIFDCIIKDIKLHSPTKLFLDYDGTLVPLVSSPELARPDSEVMKILNCLKRKYYLYIITGRDMNDIIGFIGKGFNIIAMHGAEFLDENGNVSTIENFAHYADSTRHFAEIYSDLEKKFPGLKIIDKHGGLQFHYFNVKKDLHPALEKTITGLNEEGFEVYSGKYVFELRIKGINKGNAIRSKLGNSDYALFAGDDRTDEEAFEVLRDHLTIKIGDGDTKARYRLHDFRQFRDLLNIICREKVVDVN